MGMRSHNLYNIPYLASFWLLASVIVLVARSLNSVKCMLDSKTRKILCEFVRILMSQKPCYLWPLYLIKQGYYDGLMVKRAHVSKTFDPQEKISTIRQ